jgi:hypothetical protein
MTWKTEEEVDAFDLDVRLTSTYQAAGPQIATNTCNTQCGVSCANGGTCATQCGSCGATCGTCDSCNCTNGSCPDTAIICCI